MFGQKIRALTLSLILTTVSMSTTAHGQETLQGQQSYMLPELNYTYSTDFCDFELKLPNEPSISGEGTLPEEYQLKDENFSFIKVFGLDKSLRVSGSCKQLNKEVRTIITETSINQELKAVEADQRLNIISKENKLVTSERLRIASLVGQRKATPDTGIFVYQIWVADNSIFTLETEVTGPQDEELDKLFVSILQSFKKKNTKEEN